MSSNAPTLPPPVHVRGPKTSGDWVTERWKLQRTETHLEGMRKGSVDTRPEMRFTRRFTQTDAALGLCRVELKTEAPEAAPTKTTELSLRAASTQWTVEPSPEPDTFLLRYEPRQPVDVKRLEKTVEARFNGKLVLIDGLPRALEGEVTSIVSRAAFSGERQVKQVVDQLDVTWQYGSARQ